MSQKSISGNLLLFNSVMWYSGQGTLPTSEIAMPAVITRSGIISTLRASANSFVPRVSKPASLSQKTEVVSNLRASAEPFVPAAKPNVESEPPVRASAEIFVPTQSTGLGKLESDSASSCSEDIFKLTAAKPLEAHTAIAAPAISALPPVKEHADMEALVDFDVPFDKAPIAAVVSIDSDVPSTEARTNIVASTDSDVPSPKSPADTIASVDSAIMASEAPTASSACKDSDVMSTKVPTTYVDPADSKVPQVSIRQEQASILISSSDAGNLKPEFQLQIPSDIIVPFEETSSDIPESRCIQHDDANVSKAIFDNACDDEDDMFRILATYAESSLHCEFDEIVMSRKQTTEDDFGYTYFSISNLMK